MEERDRPDELHEDWERYENDDADGQRDDSEAEDVLFTILDDVKGTPVHGLLQGVKKQVGAYDMEAAAEELGPLISEIASMTGVEDAV